MTKVKLIGRFEPCVITSQDWGWLFTELISFTFAPINCATRCINFGQDGPITSAQVSTNNRNQTGRRQPSMKLLAAHKERRCFGYPEPMTFLLIGFDAKTQLIIFQILNELVVIHPQVDGQNGKSRAVNRRLGEQCLEHGPEIPLPTSGFSSQRSQGGGFASAVGEVVEAIRKLAIKRVENCMEELPDATAPGTREVNKFNQLDGVSRRVDISRKFVW